MSNRNGKVVITAFVTATMAMSPLFSPQALAMTPSPQLTISQSQNSTTGAVGSGTAVNVNSSVYLPSGYEYLVNLYQNGTLVSPNTLYQVNEGNSPLSTQSLTINGQSVSSYVYSTTAASANFTLTPYIFGSDQASVQLYDTSSNQTVGSAVYQPMSATQPATSAGAYFSAPSNVLVNQPTMFSAYVPFTGTNSTDGIWYTIQVTQNGQTVSSNLVQLSSQNTQLTIDPSLAVARTPLGVSLSNNSSADFSADFTQTGTYDVTVTYYDQATNQLVGSTTATVTANAPNATGTIVYANGMPAANISIGIQSTNSANYFYTNIQTNSQGQYSTYLPTGSTYSMTGFSQPISTVTGTTNMNWIPYMENFLVATNQSISLPQTGVLSGTATIDGTTPLANADISIFDENSDGTINYQVTGYNTTTDANGNFTVTLPYGNYIIANIYGNSSNYGAITVNQPVVVNSSTVTANVVPPQLSLTDDGLVLEGQENWTSVSIRPDMTFNDPVYIQATVTENGTPVTSGVTMQSLWNGSATNTHQPNSSGTVTFYQNSPVSLSSGDYLGMIENFQNSGSYQIDYEIVDAKTGNVMAQTQHSIVVNAPNVNGTVLAADGKTPVANMGVQLNGPNNGLVWVNTNQSGQFSTYLPPGTWSVTQIGDMFGDQYVYSGSSEVTFTTSDTTTATPQVTDPGVNQIGTAYIDSAQTQPLANGWVQVDIVSSSSSTTGTTTAPMTGSPSSPTSVTSNVYSSPSGSSGSNTTVGTSKQNSLWLQTDSNGQFAFQLPQGDQYNVVGEYSQNGILPLGTETIYTVGSGVQNFNVSPHAPDYQVTVSLGGTSMDNGYVGVVSASDYSSHNFSNSQWLPIQNGTASGYLPSGSYVVYGVQEAEGMYFPTNTSLNITDPSTVLSVAVQPGGGQLLDASGKPIANATIVMSMSGTGASLTPTAQYTFNTDENGYFSSVGWDNSTNSVANLLTLGSTYQVNGITEQNGNWISLNDSITVGASGFVIIQLPAPLTGQVSVDGSTMQSGWIAFGPQNSVDQTGRYWEWAPIQNGAYSINLGNGNWAVYGVQDITGQYYNETGSVSTQTPITVTSGQPSPSTLNFSITDNFVGQFLFNGQPVSNGWMELSPVANPSTPQDWGNVIWLPTDASGDFRTALSTTGTWYLIGMSDQNNNYSQLSQSFTVGTTAQSNFTINVQPDVSGTISGVNIPSGDKAWIFVSDGQGNVYSSAIVNGSYQLDLPVGSYTVLGISTQSQSGNGQFSQNWIDLSVLPSSETAINVTSTSTPITQTLAVNSYSGTVSGWAGGTGYVIFTNGGKYANYSVNANGQFTVPFDNGSGWSVYGTVSDGAFSSASGSYTNGAWSVTG